MSAELSPLALSELKLISQGPGTEVYRALMPDGEPVLLKRFSLARAGDWKELDLFEREIQVLRQLVHARLPRLLAAGQDETGPYLISSWIQGHSLAQLLAQGRSWSETEVRDLARQLLELLDWLHTRQPPIVHRDIKPANLMLDASGELYLIDFGSVLLRAEPDGGSTVAGTFGYMAPEQFSGQALPASDLYAVGTTLVHLLSGVAPAEMRHERLRLHFAEHLPGCGLLPWLGRLLEPLPEDRFASARLALEWLEQPQALATAAAKLPAPLRDFQPESLPPTDVGLAPIHYHRTEAGLELVLPPRPLAREYLNGWLVQGIGGGVACYAALGVMGSLHLSAAALSALLAGVGSGAIGLGTLKGLRLRRQGQLQTHLWLDAEGLEIETRHAELTETRLQIPWRRVYELEVVSVKGEDRLLMKYLNAAGQMQSLRLGPQLHGAELRWLREQMLGWKAAAQASQGL